MTAIPNTGIYQPQGDTIAISTGGDTRFFISNNGSVGIGNENPADFNSGANNLVIGSEPCKTPVLLSLPLTLVTILLTSLVVLVCRVPPLQVYLRPRTRQHFSVVTATTEAFRVTNNQDIYIGTNVGDGASRVVVAGGSISIDDGSNGKPVINFRADLDTGIIRPGDDQLAVVTAGNQRLVIDETGRLGVGIQNPAADFHINRPTPTLIVSDTDSPGNSRFKMVASDGNLEVRVDDNNAGDDSRLCLLTETS